MHRATIVYAVFEKGELACVMWERNIKWSLEELSSKTDFPMDLIKGLFEGTRGLTLENARFFAKVLNIPFSELFGDLFSE